MENSARQFVEILNNRGKERKTSLLVLLKGRIDGEVVTDLGPAQEWCFDDDQSWNFCYTGRYRADGKGAILEPLLRQFVRDVAGGADPSAKAAAETVGRIRKREEQSWKFEQNLISSGWRLAGMETDFLPSLAQLLDVELAKGQRLVLFCEVEGKPSLETLGLGSELLDFFFDKLPERFGLVLAGVEEKKGPKIPDERIHRFELGPDYFVTSPPEDRSQPLASDIPQGEDALDVQSEINALADAIATRDMQPPLVLGVLGGWGSGKSFVLHLLEKRLLAIRRKNILDPRVRASSPYVGHFYLVGFNAWTYAKDDLWSSLMQEALLALNDQIALEQIHVRRESGDGKVLDGLERVEKILDDEKEIKRLLAESPAPAESPEAAEGPSTAAIVKDLLDAFPAPEGITGLGERLQHAYLEAKRETADELFEDLLTGRDDFSPNVVQRLTREGADAQRTLESLGNDILWRRLQGLNPQLHAELKKKEEEFREKKLKLAESEAELLEGVDFELRESHWADYVKGLGDEVWPRLKTAVERAQEEAGSGTRMPFDEAMETVDLLQKVKAGRSWRTAVFVAFVLAGIGIVLLGQEIAESWGWWTALAGGLGGVVESWSRANRWLRSRVEEFEAFDERARARQERRREAMIASLRDDPDYRDEELAVSKLESTVEAYRRKIGLTAGHESLIEFISQRLEEGGYEERLGLLHQVEQDIRHLTDGLLHSPLCAPDGVVGRETDVAKLLFPRGEPRVVLFIDDLDRCPPARVVEVLEAAQLLVKTELFVVVMAMDVRYITKALEKAYAGVLDRRGAPSGLDYIEKIVQLPYRIRPISRDAMPGYLRSQMQLKGTEPQGPGPGPGPAAAEKLSVISAPPESAKRIDETIPQSVLAFDEEELKLVQECTLAVDISPRATKRLVNVMKLIKIIWYRTGQEDVSREVKQAVVFFLTLSARSAGIMRYVLLEMESIVAGRRRRGLRQKIPALLAAIKKRWFKIEGRQAEWQFLGRASGNPKLLSPTMTVEQLGTRNIELIRSFSFVGEVDLPPDSATHQVALRLREPLEISQGPPPGKT